MPLFADLIVQNTTSMKLPGILISLLTGVALCSSRQAPTLDELMASKLTPGHNRHESIGPGKAFRRILSGENGSSHSSSCLKVLKAKRKSMHVNTFLQQRRTQVSVIGTQQAKDSVVGIPKENKNGGKKKIKSAGKDYTPVIGKHAVPVVGGKGTPAVKDTPLSVGKGVASYKASKGSSKGTSSKKQKNSCRDFTFTDQRRLQNGGEDCSPNILEVASKIPDISIFVDLIERAGLEDVFNCGGPFTLLPPNNEAFSAIDPTILAELLQTKNKDLLGELLLYHVLPGIFRKEDFQAGEIETLNGEVVVVTENPLKLNEASILDPNVDGCNGILHVIDEILVPIESDEPDFCEMFEFGGGNGDFDPSVLDVARANPNLSSIVSLIEAAGLDDVLEKCSGPFTLLLPDNAAIEALGQDAVEALLAPQNIDILQDIILYHTVPGTFPSSELETGPLDTLFTPADIFVSLKPIMFNSASALSLDTIAGNGLFHTIDEVLVPDFAPPNPVPNPAPVPVPVPGDVPVPAPVPVPNPVPVPVPVPGPVPVPATVPVPNPVPVPAPVPVPVPVPVPATVPVPNPVPVPATVPVPNPAPVPAPVPAPAPIPAPMSAPVPAPKTFRIQTDLILDASFEPAFQAAAARWESVIKGDLSDESTDGLDPPHEGCTHPAVVDDLYICGIVEPIDGEGNIAGFGRPIYLRTDASSLPMTGEMVFDSDDMAVVLESGLLNDLILHEMCHVLGFGTIWTDLGLQDENDSACPYLGTVATQEFNAISGCDSVPVEQVGEDATRCRHWSEDCFANELMTGTLNFDANPLSRVTIGALQDMGYDVSFDSADNFARDNLNGTCVCNRREREQRSLWDSKHGDVFELGRKSGRMAPKLSEEMRNYAVEQGLKILEHSSAGRLSSLRESNANYVGDKVVAVVVKDAGHYYSVVVLAPKP